MGMTESDLKGLGIVGQIIAETGQSKTFSFSTTGPAGSNWIVTTRGGKVASFHRYE
jgi:hypothetical protein